MVAARLIRNLAFSRYGPSHAESNSPAIAILHGMFGSKMNWRSIAKRLAKNLNRPVFTIDARNHGDSPHSSHMSYQLMCEDLVNLLDKVGLSSSVLIGHSMGGKTVMVTALTHPGLVQRLVVLDVVPATASGISEMQQYVNGMESINLDSIKSRREADEGLKQYIPDETIRNFLLSSLVVDHTADTARWKFNLSSIGQSMAALKGFPVIPQTYKGPTHFIGGALSQYIPLTATSEMNRLFPNSTITHIPEAGHWLHHDKPDEFMNIISKILAM